jgi:hypothetical protein
MTRTKTMRAVLGALLAGCAAATSAAQPDLVATSLSSARLPGDDAMDRAPAQFAWAIKDAADGAAPYLAESREFTTEVDAATLARGWDAPLTAPGAVVRMTPLPADPSARARPAPLTIDALEFRAGGRSYRGAEALANSADAPSLQGAGMPMPDGSIAFKLQPALGSDVTIAIVAPTAPRYVVHVYEPDSGEVLALGAARSTVLAGQGVDADLELDSAAGKSLGRVTGLLVAPDGRTQPVAFASAGSGARATVVPASAATQPGLWELHAFASSSDGTVQRDARTAFAVAVPRARTDGTPRVTTTRGGVTVDVELTVAAASRYDVSAVLYATDAAGASVPAAIAHSAAWLEPGQRTLSLAFPATLLSGSALGAPYALKSVTLTDHAQQAVVEQRTLR